MLQTQREAPCFGGPGWERQAGFRDDRSGIQSLQSVNVRAQALKLGGNERAYIKDHWVSYRRKVAGTVPDTPNGCSTCLLLF